MAENKGKGAEVAVFYPADSDLSVFEMKSADRLKHIGSIVGEDFASEADLISFRRNNRTKEQDRMINDVVSAFNSTCRENGQKIAINPRHGDMIFFVPEERIRAVGASENPIYKILPTEKYGKVAAKVMKSGVILVSVESGTEATRDTRATLAHEFGHIYRMSQSLEAGSDNDVEEGIVEFNTLQVMRKMNVAAKESYPFELKFVRAVCQKFGLKSLLDKSVADLAEIGKKYYPGQEYGHPNFIWLVEDFLDMMQHIRRGMKFINYSDSSEHTRYIEQIYNELTKFGEKWELDMFIEAKP